MVAVGGVMAGIRRYHLSLGPFPERAQDIRFRFRCTHPDCDCRDICCDPNEYVVDIT